jgi:hypothetical protein
LREERRLRVFENRVLRKVFGPKRDEVKGEWGKLHNEELNDLYSLPNIVRVVKSRRMRWAGQREDRGVHRVLVGKPDKLIPFRFKHAFADVPNTLILYKLSANGLSVCYVGRVVT